MPFRYVQFPVICNYCHISVTVKQLREIKTTYTTISCCKKCFHYELQGNWKGIIWEQLKICDPKKEYWDE